MKLGTFSGVNFDIISPKIEDINIEDIAHSLSMQCRFNGHCKVFYSVAEHSCYVCDHSVNKLWGLLHDAAETYIGDIVTPLKRYLPFVHTKEMEILELIAKKYNLSWPMPQEVKIADMRMFDTECRDLFGATDGQPYPETIMHVRSTQFAKEVFLDYFGRYYEKV